MPSRRRKQGGGSLDLFYFPKVNELLATDVDMTAPIRYASKACWLSCHAIQIQIFPGAHGMFLVLPGPMRRPVIVLIKGFTVKGSEKTILEPHGDP
jgi:hypothetical protein